MEEDYLLSLVERNLALVDNFVRQPDLFQIWFSEFEITAADIGISCRFMYKFSNTLRKKETGHTFRSEDAENAMVGNFIRKTQPAQIWISELDTSLLFISE